ncbi:MAG: PIG-L family deacetylase [Micromonosporaceae bacterium]|nr:PIG-L family deacetylase [Micromonosporaceae bacterium]
MTSAPPESPPPAPPAPPAQVSSTQRPPRAELSGITSVLAVVAHPDDESFGLGGILAALADQGVPTGLVCFTRGEASTLAGSTHAESPGTGSPQADRPGDPAVIREHELRRAAAVLGIEHVALHDYPDRALRGVDLAPLAGHVLTLVAERHPSHLLVFDQGGVTGHPDHVRSTQAALVAARQAGLPVLAWALPREVASRLNAEFDAEFLGRGPEELDQAVRVPRQRQEDAIACHHSQSADNPVLHRRLELLGDTEHLRLLYHPL